MAVQYVTAQDVRVVLPRDLSRPGRSSPELFDNTEIVLAIVDAQSEVESKTGLIYIDIDDVPELLKGITIDIATYILAIRYNALDVSSSLPSTDAGSQTAQSAMQAPSHASSHPVVARWERAEALLQAIYNGHAVLPQAPPGTVIGRTRPYVVNPYEGDLFTMADFNLGYER